MTQARKKTTRRPTDANTAVKSKRDEVEKAKSMADEFLAELDKPTQSAPEDLYRIAMSEHANYTGRKETICQCGVAGCEIGPMMTIYV